MRIATDAKNETTLAKEIGTTPQNISTWKVRNVKPYAFCEKIATEYGYSLDWLLTGEGLPFRNARDNQNKSSELLARLPNKYRIQTEKNLPMVEEVDKTYNEYALYADNKNHVENMVFIPQLDVSFVAGWGAYLQYHSLSVGRRAFSKDWLAQKGLQTDKLQMVRVMGDSMEPLLKNKDVVMLDRRVNRPVTTMPIAFRLEDTLYIKSCELDGQGNMQMISKNKEYPPIIINRKSPPNDFEIIGSVVWHAHSWV